MQAPDIIEALFGLGTALLCSLEQGRKALVDPRFKSLDAVEDEARTLFSPEDLKTLERFDKLKRFLNSRGSGGKGGKGKGKGGGGYRYQPYGKGDNQGRGRGKGKGNCPVNLSKTFAAR